MLPTFRSQWTEFIQRFIPILQKTHNQTTCYRSAEELGQLTLPLRRLISIIEEGQNSYILCEKSLNISQVLLNIILKIHEIYMVSNDYQLFLANEVEKILVSRTKVALFLHWKLIPPLPLTFMLRVNVISWFCKWYALVAQK